MVRARKRQPRHGAGDAFCGYAHEIMLIAAAFAAFAAPAFAEPECTIGETSAPVWQAIQAFEAEGGHASAAKINDGNCYEIYGVLNETKMEVFYDPTTGVELERIDA